MSDNAPGASGQEPGKVDGELRSAGDVAPEPPEGTGAADDAAGEPAGESGAIADGATKPKGESGKIEDEEGYKGTDGASPLDGERSVEPPRPMGKPRGRLRRAFAELRGTKVLGPIKDDSDQAIRHARGRQENSLRGVYGTVLLVAMCGQVAFADYFLIRYGDEMKWQLPESVVLAFFTSVVVEVIGLVLVVTTSLFPTVDKASSAESH